MYHEDGCFVGIDSYVKNMKLILRELKKIGAKIIFATTTSVCDEKAVLCGLTPPAHRNEDIINYNKAVLNAFKDEDIVINDLFSKMYPESNLYLSDDMNHPNENGKKLLGTQVANAIKACGKYKNNKIKDRQEINRAEKTIQ